jgi:hypothetical protein
MLTSIHEEKDDAGTILGHLYGELENGVPAVS